MGEEGERGGKGERGEGKEAQSCEIGSVPAAAAWPPMARRPRILLSDMCRRLATGGMRASEPGSRLTSCFMSANSSSS